MSRSRSRPEDSDRSLGRADGVRARRRRYRPLLIPTLLTAALGLSAAMARPSPTRLAREVEVLVQPAAASAGSETTIAHDDLEVLVDGREGTIAERGVASATSPVPTSAWSVVVYVDFPLTSRGGIGAGAGLVADHADPLVRLGEVSVVVAAPYAESWIDRTSDAGELRATLREVAAAAEDAGDLAGERQAAQQRGTAADPRQARAALERELELIRQRRLELLSWLAMSGAESGPRCLLLIQEEPEVTSARFFLGDDDEAPDIDRADAAAHAELTRLLASWGWTVVPLAAAAPAGRAGLAGDRLRSLAAETGGAVVGSPAELSDALASLRRARRLRLRVDWELDGRPRPLVVRQRSSGTPLRAPQWLAAVTPEALSTVRARALVEGIEPSAPNPLTVRAALLPAAPLDPGGRERARLEILLDPQSADLTAQAELRLTLLLARAAGEPLTRHQVVHPGEMTDGEGWLYREEIGIPDDLDSAAVVVEALQTGLWGGAVAEFGTRSLAESGAVTIHQAHLQAEEPSRSEPEPSTSLIRLLPPRRRSVTGRTRFEALTGSPEVASVEFLLDGVSVLVDDRPPFSALLDLGPEVRPRQIEGVARSRDGRALGRHAVTVNPTTESFQVVITRMEPGDAPSTVEIEAEVTVPPAERLDRVEFYRDEELVQRLEGEPFRASLSGAGAETGSYVRVVAYLGDGTWTEDARLLAAASAEERVNVNLVELHVIVTDRDGQPVRTLTAEDFTIRARGRSRPPERFSPGDDLPLLLGLVIDTSESMWPLMPDTKKAGAQFLGETLAENDRAFLVDFDTRPRLAQPATDDFMTLVRAFARLEAGGFTALFDAVVFSLLQFEEAQGRRALVLLTDGDDYRSRYGPRRCIRYGRDLGVPVYFVSLAGVQDPRRASPRPDLESVSRGTGGRVFYISAMDQLADAYARINKELRSQYVLAFSTDRALDREELDALEVSVRQPGLLVRTVVGGQRSD